MTLHCFNCGTLGPERWGQCAGCAGWFHFVDEETHLRLTGKLPPITISGGLPNVVPDKMTKHYDYASGDWIESRSQKRRIYKAKGMVQVSAKEEWRDKEKPRTSGFVSSYDGQKNHQSSAERDGVRTATGQRVV